MSYAKLMPSLAALWLVGLGLFTLWTGEIRPRRRWGEFGGRATYPPIRGGRAVAWALGWIACGVAMALWTWLP